MSAIPLITQRPLKLYECENGCIFSEPLSIPGEYEPTPSPGYPRGSFMPNQLVCPHCEGSFEEMRETDDE